MDRPQDSKDKLQRGRRLGRAVWVSYLATGAALAILRVALLVWLNYYQMHSHTYYPWVWYFQLGLLPEAMLWMYTRLGSLDYPTIYYLAWGSVLTLGSFIMATPILLVGWVMRRRR